MSGQVRSGYKLDRTQIQTLHSPIDGSNFYKFINEKHFILLTQII